VGTASDSSGGFRDSLGLSIPGAPLKSLPDLMKQKEIAECQRGILVLKERNTAEKFKFCRLSSAPVRSVEELPYSRAGNDNWYSLPIEERRHLMCDCEMIRRYYARPG